MNNSVFVKQFQISDLKNFIEENNQLPDWNINRPLRIFYNRLMRKKEINTISENELKEINELIKLYPEIIKSENEIFNDNIDDLNQFIKENNQLPNWKINRPLMLFISSYSYKKKNKILKDYEVIKMNEVINLYPDIFKLNIDKLNNDVNKLKKFIDTNKRKPLKNSQEIYLIRIWRIIRDRKIFNIYLNSNLADDIYSNFITDINYRPYFARDTEKWIAKLNIITDYIKVTNKLPTDKKNKFWLDYQKKFCKSDNLLYNKEIVDLYDEFIASDLYNKLKIE